MEMQLEANDRGRYVVILAELQLVFVDRINREDVAVSYTHLPDDDGAERRARDRSHAANDNHLQRRQQEMRIFAE